jgi:hypothetical protein
MATSIDFRSTSTGFNPRNYRPDRTLKPIPWLDELSANVVTLSTGGRHILDSYFNQKHAPALYLEHVAPLIATARPVLEEYRRDWKSAADFIPEKRQEINLTKQTPRIATLQRGLIDGYETIKEWARGWRAARDLATTPYDRVDAAEAVLYEARRAEALAAIWRRANEPERELFIRERAAAGDLWPIYAAQDAVEPPISRKALGDIRTDAALAVEPTLEAPLADTLGVIDFAFRLGMAIFTTLTFDRIPGIKFRKARLTLSETTVDGGWMSQESGAAEQWLDLNHDVEQWIYTAAP